jgi:uncharacterized membrane protein YoaK (UPF0700 family)
MRVPPMLLVALAALAGWVDALSFLYLGKVFTSFQSGNLIFLGLSAAQGDGGLLARAAVSLAAFVAGSAIGSYVIGRAVSRQMRSLRGAFAVELAVLAAFALCWQAVGDASDHPLARLVLIALGAAAMGIQGSAVMALRIPGVVTNAMTATLNLLGGLLGLRARGGDALHDASPLPAGILALLCASYALSAVAVGVAGHPAVLSAVPAVALALALGFSAKSRRFARRAAVPG